MTHPDNTTAMNWNQAPNNRWSFQHVQSLFPSRRLSRGMRPAHTFATASRELDEVPFTKSDGQRSTIAQMLRATFTDSMLVVQHGQIVYEQYFNGMSVDSHHLVNSVTKTFAGMLAGIAVERGQLDPSMLVSEMLPELTTDAWEGTTVRHVLDMTAGVNYLEEYEDRNTDFWHHAAVCGWRPDLVTADSPRTLLDYAATRTGKDQANGERFHYRSVTTDVLGLVIERAMGENLGDLLTSEIWQKLSPLGDASVVVDPDGKLFMGAGLSATTRDLARFGMCMVQDRMLDGEQILPSSWIDDTLAGDASSRQCMLDSRYADVGLSHYRNQTWIKDQERQQMLALGIHGQTIYMDKSAQVVIVKLSTQPEPADISMFVDGFLGMDAIVEALG